MYIKNLQSDVVGLFNLYGQLVCRYTYDTWGRVLSVTDANGNDITNQNHVANLNPIRYRGYYLDLDTGLYYLQSRYYDPETGRFINADNVAGNTGNSTYNLFVYCSNDPVNGVDPCGNCRHDTKNNIYHICSRHEESLYSERSKLTYSPGRTYIFPDGTVITTAPRNLKPNDTVTVRTPGYVAPSQPMELIILSYEDSKAYLEKLDEESDSFDYWGLIEMIASSPVSKIPYVGKAAAAGLALLGAIDFAFTEDMKAQKSEMRAALKLGRGFVVNGNPGGQFYFRGSWKGQVVYTKTLEQRYFG